MLVLKANLAEACYAYCIREYSNMVFFKRTSAVIDKTLDDLSRLSFDLAILVQVIFLGLYGFKIYASRDKAIFLILYSVLAGLSLLSFIFYLWSHNEKNFAVVMATKRSLRLGKYAANGAMIIVILVEFVITPVSDLDIVLSGLSIVSFALQIAFEFVRIFYEKYSVLLSRALEEDLEKFSRLSDPQTSLLHAVDIPLASLAKKLQGNPQEEKDETDENIEGLTADFQARKKAERKAKKAERRGQEKTAIKTHFSSIVTSLKEKRANRKKKKQGEVIVPTPVSEDELKKLPPEK
jgi:hypothetical protein